MQQKMDKETFLAQFPPMFWDEENNEPRFSDKYIFNVLNLHQPHATVHPVCGHQIEGLWIDRIYDIKYQGINSTSSVAMKNQARAEAKARMEASLNSTDDTELIKKLREPKK